MHLSGIQAGLLIRGSAGSEAAELVWKGEKEGKHR